MILLFQINPCASESVLALEHMRSFFECVLCDYYHHDVRTISAMILEHIADARQRGSGLSLPPESLFSLASRIEDQLASAKQCTPGGARTPGWQAEPQTGLPLTRVCASPWTDGLQTGMVSLLVKAAAFHAPCSQALYKLQEKFGDMQVVGGDASRPAQPNPRLLLANFNQQTVGVCQRGLEPPGAGRQGAGRVWSAAHAFEPRLGQSHVYSFVPRRALQHDSVWEVEYALYGSRIWCVRDHVHASRCHMTLVPCDTPKESCDTSFV
jgi:hypothetical protein